MKIKNVLKFNLELNCVLKPKLTANKRVFISYFRSHHLYVDQIFKNVVFFTTVCLYIFYSNRIEENNFSRTVIMQS